MAMPSKKQWAKAYVSVLFSKELWFSWFFLGLEFLMLINIGDENSLFRQNPILHVFRCLAALFILAVLFTTLGFIQAYITTRNRERVQRETEARITFADVMRAEHAFIEKRRQAVFHPQHPRGEQQAHTHEEPKQSPWFLGAWTKYLDENKDKGT